MSIYKHLYSPEYCLAGSFRRPCHYPQANAISYPSPLLHWFGLFTTIIISGDRCQLHVANDSEKHAVYAGSLQL